MLSTELAMLLHLDTVGVVLLVLFGNIVTLFALCASQSYFHSHYRHLLIQFSPVKQMLSVDCLLLTIGNTFHASLRLREVQSTKKYPRQRGIYIISYFLELVKSFRDIFSFFSKKKCRNRNFCTFLIIYHIVFQLFHFISGFQVNCFLFRLNDFRFKVGNFFRFFCWFA